MGWAVLPTDLLSCLLFHMQILVIFFKCCLLLPWLTQFSSSFFLRCWGGLPFHIFQFSTFALLSLLIVGVCCIYVYIYPYIACICSVAYIFITFLRRVPPVLSGFPFFFFVFLPTPLALWPSGPNYTNNSHLAHSCCAAGQKEVVQCWPRRGAKCLHFKLPMGQWLLTDFFVLRLCCLLGFRWASNKKGAKIQYKTATEATHLELNWFEISQN